MSLTCPLCLEQFNADMDLIRFCPIHLDRSGPATVRTGDITDSFCPEKSCPTRTAVRDGVFLLHVGCRCTNPLWDRTGNVVDINNPNPTLDGVKVDHWEIGVLQHIARAKYPTQQEMWFPQVLFQALNEARPDGRPYGALILLAGSKNSGKSVLSTLAMDRSCYEGLLVENYVNISLDFGSGPGEELLSVFRALTCMRDSQPFPPLRATQTTNTSNIKAVFVSDETGPRRRSPPPRGQTSQTWRQVLADTVREILGSGARPAPVRTRLSGPPAHMAVAFYDTPGEVWRRFDPQTLVMGSKVGIRAILLDAGSLTIFRDAFAGDPTVSMESFATAYDNYYNSKRFAGRRCLIVTKLDMLQNLDSDAAAYLEKVREARAVSTAAAYSDEARCLLIKWLQGSATRKTSRQEQDLAKWLAIDTELQVFFVWTENLAKDQNDKPTIPAECFGVVPFLKWCLEWEVKSPPTTV